MPRDERDVARILDKLTQRVDRLENQGETAAEVAIFEDMTDEATLEAVAEVLVDDVEGIAWNSAARWNTDVLN